MICRLPTFALAVLVALGSGACSRDDENENARTGDFGPLALIDDPGTGTSDALGGTGVVNIDERCVTLMRENGDVLLLVWRSGEVRWESDDREIVFSSVSSPDAPDVTIHNGDMITVGGESFGSDEPRQQARRIMWKAEPDDRCPGERFIVEAVSR